MCRIPRAAMLGVSVLVVALTGCGRTSGGTRTLTSAPPPIPASTTSLRPTTTTTTALPSPAVLQARLLTVGDFPQGWTVVAPARNRKGSGKGPTVTPAPADNCERRATAAFVTAPVTARAFFVNAPTRGILTETVAAFALHDAEQAMATGRATAQACVGQVIDQGRVGNVALRSRVDPSPLPALGDESYALRTVSLGGSSTFTNEIVIVRVGARLLTISAGYGTGAVDPAFVESVTRAAITALR